MLSIILSYEFTGKLMRSLTDNNKLKELERELAERILHLAAFLDNCFDNGNGDEDSLGSNIVKYIDGNTFHLYDEKYDKIDLFKYRIGRSLPYYYDYAYNSKYIREVDKDIEDIFVSFSNDYKDKHIFNEFLELTNTHGIVSSVGHANWGEVKKTESTTTIQPSGLEMTITIQPSGLLEMNSLFNARHRLDFSNTVTIADIVLLTNMNEKSIRNALRDEGENKLHSRLDPKDKGIDSSEALRWMCGRKSGFRETTVIDSEKDKLPEYLRHIDIGPFIEKRLEKFYSRGDGKYPYTDIAQDLGYSDNQLSDITANIDNLPIKDTHRIAKVIKVDPAWFTEQVFVGGHCLSLRL